jgi:hypothetical protein
MLADLFLQFSAPRFCFTDQGRKEIREKGREKRKKRQLLSW